MKKEVKKDKVQAKQQKGSVRKQRHPSTWRTVPALRAPAKFIPRRYKPRMKGIGQKAARLSSRNRATYQKPRTRESKK